jgi:hypothetical protein
MLSLKNNLTNQNFEELYNQIKEIKPKFQPILDAITLKTLGDYAYDLLKSYEWNVAKNIPNDIIYLLKTDFKNIKISDDDIFKFCWVIINKNEGPKDIGFNFLYFFQKEIKNQLPNLIDFLNFKKNFSVKINKKLDNYKPTWKLYKKKYQLALNLINYNFKVLESDDDFNNFFLLLEKIKENISYSVEKYIDQFNNLSIELNEKKDKFNKYYDELIIKELKKLNFDDNITKTLIQFFDNEKSFYHLLLNIDSITNNIKAKLC